MLSTRLASIFFVAGKLIRFWFFLGFLLVLKTKVTLVAGYTIDQLVVFFLIYNLFDLLGQFLFRGIYWFRQKIVSGDFDFYLVKPLNPLFQVLFSHTDFLDLPLLIVTIIYMFIYLPAVSVVTLFHFCLFAFIAMTVTLAIHIVVAAIGIITTEVDHTIWIFRDLSTVGRMPITAYPQAVQLLFTYLVPIAFISTFPAQTLLGQTPVRLTVIATFFALFVYLLAIKFWHYALKQYSSASS